MMTGGFTTSGSWWAGGPIVVRLKAEAFGFAEFVERTAEHAGTDVDVAEVPVIGVFVTLRESITPAEFDDVLSKLPADFERLGTSR
jgi:uncharacterized protein (DUF2267 family)